MIAERPGKRGFLPTADNQPSSKLVSSGLQDDEPSGKSLEDYAFSTDPIALLNSEHNDNLVASEIYNTTDNHESGFMSVPKKLSARKEPESLFTSVIVGKEKQRSPDLRNTSGPKLTESSRVQGNFIYPPGYAQTKKS